MKERESERGAQMPQAMRDIGTPQAMSDFPQGEAAQEAPIVEVTKPFHLGEGLEEIRSPEDLADDI